MKKRILIVLTAFSLLFLISGVSIIYYIEKTTSTLDNIIKLHQVELLRDELLITIKRVQTDLSLRNTRYAKGIDTIIKDVSNMGGAFNSCFACHHSADVVSLLEKLNLHIMEYKNAMSRVFTIRANINRLEQEEDNAFRTGQNLITDVKDILAFAGGRLEKKTKATRAEIYRAKVVIFILLALGPLLTIGLAIYVIRGFAKPIDVLLNATRKFKSGELDYKMEGLEDEFGEVAASFNEMGSALQDHMREIQESEKRYRTLFESAGDAIFILEAERPNEGRIVSANRAAAGMYGYSCDELLHLNVGELYATEAADYVLDWIREILQGRWLKMEHNHRQKDGTVFPVEVSAGLLELKNQKHILAFSRNITERKKLEEQLHHAQRMEAIGRLTGGLAHEFNNILQAIIAYGDILQKALSQDETLKGYADMIITSCQKAANLTNGLLAYSRKQAIHQRPVSLGELITSIKGLLSKLIGEDIELKIDLPDEDITLQADPNQIEQVLLNLATNARDAMPNRGVLTISACRFAMDEQFTKSSGYGEPGMYALISVRDTGVGMDERTKERVFEPFFTTKAVGKGTGLGLSVVYGIVRKHNGYIDVASEVGRGTEFRIFLPDIKADVQKIRQIAQPPPEGGRETVLVAEDDIEVREIISAILENSGYNVIEAVDGQDALEKFMFHKSDIHFFLSDVVMPRKSGKEVYDDIKKIRPDVKALFISGYTDEALQERGVFQEGLNLITKPILPTELLRKIRKIMDKKTG